MNNEKKHDKKIAELLNECFESMVAKGESLDSCLLSHPEQARELKPLLETMKTASEASSISPDASFRARARYEFRKALYDDASRRTRPALSLRWATVAASLGVFILTGAGGAVAASSSSMPGQFLYQVKRNIENVQITTTPSQASKARLYATLADHRISELVFSAESGDVQLTESLTRQFTSDLGMVFSIAAAERRNNDSGNSAMVAPAVSGSVPGGIQSTTGTNSTGSKGVTPATTSLPATTVPMTGIAAVPPVIVSQPPMTTTNTVPPPPTIEVTELPQVTVTVAAPVPAPVITLTQASNSGTQSTSDIKGITDPVLLKLLQQYSVKNIAELMSILDKVPPSTKAALLAALQAATSAYSQILGG